ncbi:hypothetical protein [Myxococcus sp. RHSTA-1-4]|uniref:TPR end-of-group domain-containing protein n=1 Tax=Myxococcus sp. RHSTA-1-4 TaxID=2874601 RepID=UPI001CC1B021|nr:hypothetical protein [Myxococcus sp. RHSTA-1-4]MBZ4416210.1 hypothetical protein [Myxococcus sp. RHSTA-1-4]
MRMLTPALLLLVAGACAHAPAPAEAPVTPAAAPAPATSSGAESPAKAPAAELPHMDAPGKPVPAWEEVKRADKLMDESKHAEALALYKQALDAGNTGRNTAYSAACAAALLGQKQEALRLLSLAAEHGYRNVKWMQQDSDLASLRSEPAFTALVQRIPTMLEPHAAENAELQRLYQEDQADRSPPPATKEGWKEVSARDEQRRLRVKELVAAGALKNGGDFVAAAFVFQHGNTLEDYAMARRMGAEAAKLGHPAGLWIAAAAWDRWLMMAGRPQRFGTQYQIDPNTKEAKLYQVDPGVPDEERARWGFPPLAEIPQVMR